MGLDAGLCFVRSLGRLGHPAPCHLVLAAGALGVVQGPGPHCPRIGPAPSTRADILRRFWAHLAPGGRAIIGFGTDRGYEADTFREHAAAAGFHEDLLLSTWDLRPYAATSDFPVAVLRRGSGVGPA